MTQPEDKSILREIVRVVESRRRVPDRVQIQAREYLITYLEDHRNRLDEALRRYDPDRLNMLFGQLASKIKYQFNRMVPARAVEKTPTAAKPTAAKPTAAKPTAAKPTAAKKAAAKKAAGPRASAAKPAAAKAPGPRASAKKAPARKPVAKKTAAPRAGKRTPAAKKTAAKKPPAKKAKPAAKKHK